VHVCECVVTSIILIVYPCEPHADSTRSSWCHADDNRITVTDLRSTNGTYVDGEEIEAMQAYEVTPGSRIIFGDEHLAQYEVMLGEDDPPAETAPAAAAPETEKST
jgi:hypothetical protein